MPLFEWQGKSVTGEIRRGVLDAPNQQLVEVCLRRLNIIPIKIKLKKESAFRIFRRKSVSEKDLTTFTRQFAVVLEAGLPIIKSLEVLAEQQKNPYFKNVLKDIKVKVETGSILSDAMAEYPKLFDNLYVHMVKSGESSGNLDVVLKRLAGYLERILSLKGKVKHAMVYPSVIVIVTIAVISIIMLFVIPKFVEIYKSAGQALPLPTQILINISNNSFLIFLFWENFLKKLLLQEWLVLLLIS